MRKLQMNHDAKHRNGDTLTKLDGELIIAKLSLKKRRDELRDATAKIEPLREAFESALIRHENLVCRRNEWLRAQYSKELLPSRKKC